MRVAHACAAAFLTFAACTTELALEPCTSGVSYALGTTVAGSIESGDGCTNAEDYSGHMYEVTVAEPTGIGATLKGNNVNLLLYQGTVASGSSAKRVMDAEGKTVNVFVPAGSYYFAVVLEGANAGNYSLTTGPHNTTGCDHTNFVVRGATVSGTVTGSDCTGGSATVRQDIYEIWLDSGNMVTVTASSSRPGAVLLRTGSASSADLHSMGLGPNTQVQFNFTAPSAGWYRVHMLATDGVTQTANYSFSIL